MSRKRNLNPLLDTRVYTTELLDGYAVKIYANTAAEYIFQNCDTYGNMFILFKSIMNDKPTDKAVKKSDIYITCKEKAPGCRTIKRSGKLLIEWDYGMRTW